MAGKATAIVLAAGQGKRMGTGTAKQFLELNGKPVVVYSLETFEKSDKVDSIVLVTGKDYIPYCEELVKTYGISKVRAVIEGGAERYLSVWEALRTIREIAGKCCENEAAEKSLACDEDDIIYIHDGARPFVTEEIIGRAYEAAKKTKACVVGMPVKDTIKIADEEGFASQTPNRSRVWMIQTPQTFEAKLIIDAYASLIESGRSDVTDDAMVVESQTDVKVKLVEGSYSNIKLTTPDDLKTASVFL